MRSRSAILGKTAIVFAAIISAVLLGGPSRTGALSDTGLHVGPDGVYQYYVEDTDDGLDIGVTIDTREPDAWTRYLRHNDERNRELAESRSNRRLPVTITFAKPLPLQEGLALLAEAHVEPVDYTQVGWTASGQRMGSTFWASPDRSIEELAAEAATATRDEEPNAGARMAGFLVVNGYLVISESLGKLLADERVYVVDTTAWEIQQALGPTSRNATFSLPTPFWGMDWSQ